MQIPISIHFYLDDLNLADRSASSESKKISSWVRRKNYLRQKITLVNL